MAAVDSEDLGLVGFRIESVLAEPDRNLVVG
jgi:hypothetical protein